MTTTTDERRAPYWVRLIRLGTAVTALSSGDGRTWTTIGTDAVALYKALGGGWEIEEAAGPSTRPAER